MNVFAKTEGKLNLPDIGFILIKGKRVEVFDLVYEHFSLLKMPYLIHYKNIHSNDFERKDAKLH